MIRRAIAAPASPVIIGAGSVASDRDGKRSRMSAGFVITAAGAAGSPSTAGGEPEGSAQKVESLDFTLFFLFLFLIWGMVSPIFSKRSR